MSHGLLLRSTPWLKACSNYMASRLRLQSATITNRSFSSVWIAVDLARFLGDPDGLIVPVTDSLPGRRRVCLTVYLADEFQQLSADGRPPAAAIGTPTRPAPCPPSPSPHLRSSVGGEQARETHKPPFRRLLCNTRETTKSTRSLICRRIIAQSRQPSSISPLSRRKRLSRRPACVRRPKPRRHGRRRVCQYLVKSG